MSFIQLEDKVFLNVTGRHFDDIKICLISRYHIISMMCYHIISMMCYHIISNSYLLFFTVSFKVSTSHLDKQKSLLRIEFPAELAARNNG